MDLFDTLPDPERDQPNMREIALPTGNKLYAKRDPQFGFWTFNLDKGQIPRWMSGKYTSISEAQAAVKRYLQEKDFSVSQALSDRDAEKEMSPRQIDGMKAKMNKSQ